MTEKMAPENPYLDKMVLGTVQMGMDYGIANQGGRCTEREAFKILETAWNAGIRRFDTAPAYFSEIIIGEFVRANGIEDKILICTKIPSLDGKKDWGSFLRETVHRSLDLMGADRIHVLFIHDPHDFHLLIRYSDVFYELLRSYPILSLGISAYDPDDIKKIGDCGFDLAVQFPFNVLDRRFEASDIRKGKRYARSVFLQGVLASKERLRNNAPEALNEIHEKVHRIFRDRNFEPLSYALGFVANSSCLDYFLFGVDHQEQLGQILGADLSSFHNDYEIDRMISSIDKYWLDPRNWIGA